MESGGDDARVCGEAGPNEAIVPRPRSRKSSLSELDFSPWVAFMVRGSGSGGDGEIKPGQFIHVQRIDSLRTASSSRMITDDVLYVCRIIDRFQPLSGRFIGMYIG